MTICSAAILRRAAYKIAVIARHRRHRTGSEKQKLTTIDADNTDQNWGLAKLNPGVESWKSLFFGVD
jgi:hypothetical protein